VTARKAGRPTQVARDLGPRRLTDAREIRALAHPIRTRLLEALMREGPLTATEAGELLDESPANCSFHLRTLAKYGFVEEAEGGTGRNRPWRRVTLGQSFSEADDDPEVSVAAQSLAELAHEQTFERIRQFMRRHGTFPMAWRKAASASDCLVYLTPEELEGIGAEFLEILFRYRDRTMDIAKRPEGARPVQLAAFGIPLPPSPSGN
jgi:DNA-binding transcriptional ArsR family regulator